MLPWAAESEKPMKTNKLRELLSSGKYTVSTRVANKWPLMVELIGSLGYYDYIEFLAEYAPYNPEDLENICRAAELNNMASMIKIDYQNRAYVAQKAMGSGFQAILFTDCKTAEDVKESIFFAKPDTLEDAGRCGYPNRRWIGYQPNGPQMEYAAMVRSCVMAFMIEKVQAVDNIEAICKVPGVDMVQFGPSDYAMSRGWNKSDHTEEILAAERHVIEVALANGVHPRCEINDPEQAKYYYDLGVRHFSIGDELHNATRIWTEQGKGLRGFLGTVE